MWAASLLVLPQLPGKLPAAANKQNGKLDAGVCMEQVPPSSPAKGVVASLPKIFSILNTGMHTGQPLNTSEGSCQLTSRPGKRRRSMV